MRISIEEADGQLSELLKRVQVGDEVVIEKAGVPIAVITQLTPSEGRAPKLGCSTIKFTVPDNFDDHDPEHYGFYDSTFP